MKELVVLTAKIYSYLTGNNNKNKKSKGTKKSVVRKN